VLPTRTLPPRELRETRQDRQATAIAFVLALAAVVIGDFLSMGTVSDAGPWLLAGALCATISITGSVHAARIAIVGMVGGTLATVITLNDASLPALLRAAILCGAAAVSAVYAARIIAIDNPRRHSPFARGRMTTRFVVIAVGLISSATVAVIASVVAGLQGEALSEAYSSGLRAAVLQALGLLATMPLVAGILAWRDTALQDFLSWPKKLEALALVAGLLVVLMIVTNIDTNHPARATYRTYWLTPFILWAALRFGPVGTALVFTTLVAGAIAWTARGLGPYAQAYPTPDLAVIAVAIYLVVVGAMGLIAAALIAEREWALAQAAAWRKRFEAAVEASGEALYEYVPTTSEMRWSGAVERVLGIPAEEMDSFGQFLLRIRADDRERVALHFEGLAGGEDLGALEYRIVRPDGSQARVQDRGRAISVHARRGPHSEPLRVIGFVRDISAERALQKEQARMETRLYQAERLQAIGRLAGAIAHDFNNILGAVLGYGQMLSERLRRDSALPEAATLERHAQAIVAAGERGRSLVDQVFAFSREQPLKMGAVPLAPLVAEVCELLAGSLPADIMVRKDVIDATVCVNGHATRLHQLLMNLASNAVRAMPSGGTLTIQVRRQMVPDSQRLSHGDLSPGTYARVEIADTGRGMDAATLARVFEPFFTTGGDGGSRRGSVGLGLTIVQSILEEHHAVVDIASEPNIGTRFAVYLPAVEALAGGPLPASVGGAGVSAALDGKGRVVLVVDDEEPLRAMAEDMLAEFGFEPVGAADGEEALALLRSDPSRFDMVFSDEVMPGMTGTDMTALARALAPHLPIVITSGYGGVGFEARAIAAGADAVLKKPYTRVTLEAALNQALAAHRSAAEVRV
jgi:PAS domain S-box-containing protein